MECAVFLRIDGGYYNRFSRQLQEAICEKSRKKKKVYNWAKFHQIKTWGAIAPHAPAMAVCIQL
jgi:hypothetical protein